jgi:hypothetical protein
MGVWAGLPYALVVIDRGTKQRSLAAVGRRCGSMLSTQPWTMEEVPPL